MPKNGFLYAVAISFCFLAMGQQVIVTRPTRPHITVDSNVIPNTAPSFSFPNDGTVTRQSRLRISDLGSSQSSRIYNYQIPVNGTLILPIIVSNCQSVIYVADQAPISIVDSDCNHITMQAANTLRSVDCPIQFQCGASDTNITMTVKGTDGSTLTAQFKATAYMQRTTISNLIIRDFHNNNQPVPANQLKPNTDYQLDFYNSDSPGSFAMYQPSWWASRVGFIFDQSGTCVPQAPLNMVNSQFGYNFANFGSSNGSGYLCTYNMPDVNGYGGGPSINYWPVSFISANTQASAANPKSQSGSEGSVRAVFSKSLEGLKRSKHK